jgi:hypothetical protein
MKKIMFNEKFGLEDLVLQKIKDMTRRIALDAPVENMDVMYDTKTHQCCICSGNLVVKRSQYAVGEVVAIAQSYNTIEKEINRLGLPLDLKSELYKVPGFKNKMFVKAELMPHHIKITNIRVERLQDISDEDAMREGIIMVDDNEFNYYPYISEHTNYLNYHTPRVAFSRLIDNVSGKGTWEKNPFVFVYEFELID